VLKIFNIHPTQEASEKVAPLSRVDNFGLRSRIAWFPGGQTDQLPRRRIRSKAKRWITGVAIMVLWTETGLVAHWMSQSETLQFKSQFDYEVS
jgi:hypothetical protein